MGYHRQRIVAIVPAARVKEFNDVLARHGYGADNLNVATAPAVTAKGAAEGAAASHYVLELQADSGLAAAIRLAMAAANDKLSAAAAGACVAKTTDDTAKPCAPDALQKLNLTAKAAAIAKT